MKKVSVGVDRDRGELQAARPFDNRRKIRMKGRFPTEQDQIGWFSHIGKNFQPGPDGFQRQGFGTMLFRIDIAVAALQVAARQNMEEEIDGIGGKRHRLFAKHRDKGAFRFEIIFRASL